MNFEYTKITYMNTSKAMLELEMNVLGSLGWEAVGISWFDGSLATVGVSGYTVLFKREAPSYPSPEDKSPAWLTDPSGRAPQRYWDGLRWTEHVNALPGGGLIDPPNVRPS